MIYAYIRVSSEKQSNESQKEMIIASGYKVDDWFVDDAISGTVDWKKRGIFQAIERAEAGDSIIVAEMSRIGRTLKQILEVVEICIKRKIVIVMIREGITLEDDSPIAKLLISILGALSEMERNLISQRTKDALAVKRKNGVVLGRPKGKTTEISKMKLWKHRKELVALRFTLGWSFYKIGEHYNVNRITVCKFIKRLQEEGHIGQGGEFVEPKIRKIKGD